MTKVGRERSLCTIRSLRVGIPKGLIFPLAFGMYTRRAGIGEWVPASSSARMSSRSRWSVRSILALVIPSTPEVLDPEAARVIRAGSAISRSKRSNLRSLSCVDQVANLCCILPIIKDLHLVAIG